MGGEISKIVGERKKRTTCKRKEGLLVIGRGGGYLTEEGKFLSTGREHSRNVIKERKEERVS